MESIATLNSGTALAQGVCVAATLLYFIWLLRRRSGRLCTPPAPGVKLPIIGHLHLLMCGTHPHRVLDEMANKHKAPLMMLLLGSTNVLVASTPDMAKEILQKQDGVFASRPRSAFGEHVLYGCRDISTAPLGPLWRSLRLLCTSHLLTKRRVQDFAPIVTEEIRSALGSVFKSSEAFSVTAVPLRRILWVCANNIICRMSFGYPAMPSLHADEQSAPVVDSAARQRYNLLHLTEEATTLFGAVNIGEFLPWLAWVDPQGYVKRMKTLSRDFNGLFDRIIQDARASRLSSTLEGTPPDRIDLLDSLLSLTENEKHLPGSKVSISDNIIKALLMDMFGAGTETWSLTVEWAVLELINNPGCMRKLQEELQNEVGMERFVEDSDIQRLPYLHAVVKETFRLHPVVPLLVPHLSIAPCQIGKYYVPPNTYTFINVWAIHRGRDAWPDRPLDFYPERFLAAGMNVEVHGQDFELLPFGSGRRACPGLYLGLSNVCLTLANLVHAFDLWSPNAPFDTFETTGLTIKPQSPVTPYARPRLPHSLY